MSEKGKTTTLAERVAIGERSEAGENDRAIAQALNRPLSTVRKWRRRYQSNGRSGLCSAMGRPATGPLGQFSEAIRQAVLEMRDQNPGWGPQTLCLELAQDERFVGQELPSRPRLAAFLKAKQKSRPYQKHQALPEQKAEPIERPHQEWELDAQGQIKVAGLGWVSIINVLDVFSHLTVGSHGFAHVTHPDADDHQLILRRAFLRFGLPELISLDHDSVFYDNRCASPFPTRLHLWLLALGVQVRHIQDRPPKEHARIERRHLTMLRQAVLGQTFTAEPELQRRLESRRRFMNRVYPSPSLDGQAPLQAFPEAGHTGRFYRPEWEADMLDLQRVYDYLAQGRWFRKTSAVGMFSLGGQRYNARTPYRHQDLEITFQLETQDFIFRAGQSLDEVRIPAQGLTKEGLMGELAPLTAFENYQMALPFCRQTLREYVLCQDRGDTTL